MCGIIAGAGSFPFHVARAAKRQGLTVIAIGLEGWVDSGLKTHVDAYEEVAVGRVGQLINRLKTHQVRQAVMAGKVTKRVLLDPRVIFDAETIKLLSRAKEFTVNQLLGALGERLAEEGITLLDSAVFLQDELCPEGVLSRRAPTTEEREDIRVGVRAARQLAALDVGQTVVVKGKVVVAVEALEGTDATITRAGQLAGEGCVIVKTASPAQDMRFDLPVLGLQTVAVAKAAGARCLAVEAHRTLLLEKAAVLAHADDAKLSLVGIKIPIVSS